MADCPKCAKHLSITDWKQHCPHCGANIVVYDLQERLMKDADIAEVQYYHFQKKVDRLKASFVGSKLAVLRIVTSLIPIAALILPIVSITLAAPFEVFSGNLGLIDIYNMVDKINPDAFISLLSDDATKIAGIFFILSVLCLVLSIVSMLVHFFCNMLACSPKGKIRSFSLDIIFIALAVLSLVFFTVIPENPVVSGGVSYGAILYIVLAGVNFLVDYFCFRQNIPVKHSQCYVGGIPIEEYFEMVESGMPHEDIRKEMYKRLSEIQREHERKVLAEKKDEGGE